MRITNKKNQLFEKRSQYIRTENPLHKQSEKAYMCFNTRWASTRDYTVFIAGLGHSDRAHMGKYLQ